MASQSPSEKSRLRSGAPYLSDQTSKPKKVKKVKKSRRKSILSEEFLTTNKLPGELNINRPSTSTPIKPYEPNFDATNQDLPTPAGLDVILDSEDDESYLNASQKFAEHQDHEDSDPPHLISQSDLDNIIPEGSSDAEPPHLAPDSPDPVVAQPVLPPIQLPPIQPAVFNLPVHPVLNNPALNNPEPDNPPPEPEMAAAAENIARSLNNLTLKPPDSFTGENGASATEFLREFDDWLRSIGKYKEPLIDDPNNIGGPQIANPEYGTIEKQYLKQCLTGDAKQWFKNLNPDKPYAEIRVELKDTYDLTDAEKHSLRLRVYRMQQSPGESFKSFALRVKTAARYIDIADRDLISIVTYGAESRLRPFLMTSGAGTFTELLKHPLAREEDQLNRDTDFVGLIDEIDETEATSPLSSMRTVRFTNDEEPQETPMQPAMSRENSNYDGRGKW